MTSRHPSVDEVTLRGLVCPSAWHEDLSVSRVSILTFDDDEYEVADNEAGTALLNHIRHEVLVRGRLLTQHTRRKVILIRELTVFEGARTRS